MNKKPRKPASRKVPARQEKAESIHETVNRKRDNIISSLKRVSLPAEYDEALDRLQQHLRSSHKRFTIERGFVLRMLYQLAQPVDIGTLHQLVCQELGNVALTTVYSTLELLVQLQLAQRLELVSHGMTFFERTLGVEPHGYVACSQCGSISMLRQPQILQSLQSQLPRGFMSNGYTLIVHGLCSKCQRKVKQRKR